MEPIETFIRNYLIDLAPGEALELRAIRERPHDARSRIATDAGALLAFARFYDAQRYNLYYGLAPRRDNARQGRREDLASASRLWADLDAKDYATGKDGALAALDNFTLAPTTLIDSGGGYQATWDLAASVPPAGFAALEAVNRRLVAFLEADPNALDIARIFRLPGTRNHKYDPAPTVRIVADTGITYHIDEFLDLFPAPTRVEPDSQPATSHADDPPDFAIVADALAHIDPSGHNLSYHGWVSILMAIHATFPGDDGMGLAVEWAQGKPGEVEAKWQGFRGTGVGPGSIFYHARQAGWTPPRQDPVFEWVPPDPKADGQGSPAPKARHLNIITAREFMAMTFPPKRWLVEGLLPAASLSLLAAKPKLGKSQLALNLGWAVATGKPFLGHATQQGRVLYISYEQGVEGLHPLYHQLVPAYAPADADLDAFSIHGGFKSVPQTIPELIDRFADGERWDLIILDPLSKALDITDGNNYNEVYAKLDPVLEFAMTNRTHVLAIHHSHKAVSEGADAVMGSTAFTGAVEVVMMLRRDLETGHILFSTINRWAAPLPEMAIEFDEGTRNATLRGGRIEVAIADTRARIAGYLAVAGEAAERDIKLALAPLPEMVVAAALRELEATMRVQKLPGRPATYRMISWSRPQTEIADAQYPLTEEA